MLVHNDFVNKVPVLHAEEIYFQLSHIVCTEGLNTLLYDGGGWRWFRILHETSFLSYLVGYL